MSVTPLPPGQLMNLERTIAHQLSMLSPDDPLRESLSNALDAVHERMGSTHDQSAGSPPNSPSDPSA